MGWVFEDESAGIAAWVPQTVAASGIFDPEIFDALIFDGRETWANIGNGSSQWTKQTGAE